MHIVLLPHSKMHLLSHIFHGFWARLSWVLCLRDYHEAATEELAGTGVLSEGSNYFQAHVVVGKIGSLQAVEPRPLVPSWLLAGGCPQFLATWAAPA